MAARWAVVVVLVVGLVGLDRSRLAASVDPDGTPATTMRPASSAGGAAAATPTSTARPDESTAVAPADHVASPAPAPVPPSGASAIPDAPVGPAPPSTSGPPAGSELSPHDWATAPTAGLVGDSMMFSTFQDVFGSVTADRRIVFQRVLGDFRLDDVHDATVAGVRRPDGPDILLVELGSAQANNDSVATWERELGRFLDAVAPHVDCLRWFDLQTEPTGFYRLFDRQAAAFNAVTRRVAARHPNVEVVPYSAWRTMAGRSYVLGDNLHPNRRGAREMGIMMRQAANGCDPGRRSGPFWDVLDSHWAAEAISWAAGAGLVNGYPDGTFRASIGSLEFDVTRAEVVSMLWRRADSPAGHPSSPWSDAPPWLGEALAWAHATGTVSGYPDGTFRPDAAVNRGQMITMLWRISGSPTGHGAHPWTDTGRWLEQALGWAHATGAMTGYPDGTFRALEPISRAQVASVLHRLAAPPG